MKRKLDGFNTHRLASNPLEARYASVWRRANKGSCSLLANIINPDPASPQDPPEPSDRDYLVAGSVIQWLGSPVGQQFVADVLRQTKE